MPRPLSQGKKPYKPLSPQRIERILSDPSKPLPFSDAQTADADSLSDVSIFPPENRILHREWEYDSLNPEEALKSFLSFLRSVQSRFNSNYEVVGKCDLALQDILHKMEMGDNMDVQHGYQIYKLARDVRRERRTCKNENDLLSPICDFLASYPDFITSLERLQGEVSSMKRAIDNRRYTMRTDIFEQEESNGANQN